MPPTEINNNNNEGKNLKKTIKNKIQIYVRVDSIY